MKRALVGVMALVALFVVGYAVQAITPRSQSGVLAVAPPSPIPSPVAPPIPSPVVTPSQVPSPTPTALPSALPTVQPTFSPVPIAGPPVFGPTWTSLGLAGNTEVWRRCDGHATLYVAAGILTVVAGGC